MNLTNSNDFSMDEIYRTTIDYCSKLDYAETILDRNFVDNTNKIYFSYPLLFKGLFDFVAFDKNFIEQLSIAGFLLYRSIIINDRIRDEDEVEKVGIYGKDALITVSEYCKKEAFILLGKLFRNESIFWRFIAQAKAEFDTEKCLEREIEKYDSVYDKLSKFRELSYVKAVFGRLALDALLAKTLETSTIKEEIILYEQHRVGLEQYKTISFALQVLDDIDDISIDFERQQTNIVIELVGGRSEKLTINEIKGNFYFSGLAVNLLSIVQSGIESIFKQTLREKSNVLDLFLRQIYTITTREKYTIENYNKTKEYANSFMGDIYKDDISSDIQSVIDSLKEQNINEYISKGVRALIANARDHFKEAYHFMYLPPNQDFIDDGVYVGNLFPLSTLLIFFQNLESYSGVSLSKLTQPICEYILSKRQDNYHGTWCYLNDFKYLAPDLDDMSQIIRGLGGVLANKHCSQVLFVTAERIIQEGAPLTTWIPAMASTDKSRRQVYLNETKWKDTVDIEVVANLLLLFDTICYRTNEKFKQATEILLEYVLTQYSKIGDILLSPRWYYSALYPTYLLSKLTNTYLPHDFSTKIVDLIMNRQNVDGGWGNDCSQNKSDPLNTSLAVISLQNFSKRVDVYGLRNVMKQGIEYIQNTQKSNGLWEKVHFIKPRFEEPYSSKLITTVFCIEALIGNENKIQ
ncbi:MAG: hypothetical protein SOW44_07935 [Porphyromonas sp.]|nr:hypothetical protein [Bacteroidales bacterium]MDY3101251.1 hypothetical protein [Porphyromonas sp.]